MNRNIQTNSNESQYLQKNQHEELRNSSFDERRVQVLKARIIHLERQNQLLLDSIGQRATSFQDVDGILTSVANCCRKYIAKEGCPGREVNVERADLISCVTQLETARKKMYHQGNKMAAADSLRPAILQDCLLSNDSNTPMTPTSLLDCSTGKLEHLNLKFVARLESRLSSLLRELVQLQHSLDSHKTLATATPTSTKTMSKDFLVNSIEQHQKEQIEKCCQLLQASSEHLMDLTMLHPSVPWGPLRRPLFQSGITVEQIMAALPRSSSIKIAKSKAVIEALMKAVNYKQLMCQQQIQALKAELKFHREVYSLQISYTHSLMTSLREGYKQFHDSTAETLFLPLKDILSAFFQLKSKGDEESWTKFLSRFKANADTLEKATEWMSEHHLHSKEVLLDSYMSDFHRALAQLELTNQNKTSEVSQLRSENLVKYQHLEDSFNEYLTLKDREHPKDITNATTLEASLSGENVSNSFLSENIKRTRDSLLSFPPDLMSTSDPDVSVKRNLKDSMSVRQGNGNKKPAIDGCEDKSALKSKTKTLRKKIP